MFGHSDTHVALQIVDIVTSGLIVPIACWAYCSKYANNVNVTDNYMDLREMFGPRLKSLEYRYPHADGGMRGGLRVRDNIHQWPTHLLFRADEAIEGFRFESGTQPRHARMAGEPDDPTEGPIPRHSD